MPRKGAKNAKQEILICAFCAFLRRFVLMKVILLDIEGTTTPIDFVHKTLFPFARNQMREFVRSNIFEIQDEVAQLRAEHAEDYTNGLYLEIFDEGEDDSVSAYLQFLIDVDRKSTPLKLIQGKIWQNGYESGELASEIFEDVPKALKHWKEQGKTIAIYSSGSVLAQKLIFKYSNQGDLTSFIDRYFDTKVGHKREGESYASIASALNLAPENILFISDVVEELAAGESAGFQTLLSVRPGNLPVSSNSGHRIIHTFDEAV